MGTSRLTSSLLLLALVACDKRTDPVVKRTTPPARPAAAVRSFAALNTQQVDSVTVDSVITYNINTHTYSTEVDTVYDTVSVSGPTKGVDTTKFLPDSLRLTYWSIVRQNDSTRLIVLAPAPTLGVLWGPSGYFNETSSTVPGGVLSKFTYGPNNNATRSAWLLDNIKEAVERKIPVQLALPCGPHSGDRDANGNMTKLGNCLIDSSGVATFSRRRFDSTAKAILTPAIRDSVIKYYKLGWVTSFQIMDEPWVHGGDDGAGNVIGNTWGPAGTIKRIRADSLCDFVKKLVPGVPVGLSDHLTAWDPNNKLKICDYSQPQYSYRFGAITTWRDAMLAKAQAAGHKTMFSFNIINGGTQDRDAVWDCVNEGGIKGQRKPNCQMTPAQVKESALKLAPFSNGGQMMWRYDATRYNSPAYLAVIQQVLDSLAKLPRRPLTPR